jgi:hypothetical protein
MSKEAKNGFEEAEAHHLESFSRLSARQKLDWLQQAKEFCKKYLGAARPASPPKPPST